MKKFVKEFKEFITRGNVLDMAVGIIVGGAFTAIITALVTYILNPLLAMIPGTDNMGALQVVLREVKDAEGNLDLANSVIMDFGAVISAVITFILTALVLFIIVKAVNHVHQKGLEMRAEVKKKLAKGEDKNEETAVETVEETVVEETVENPVVPEVTTEQLLAEIRDLLKAQNQNKE